MNKNVNVVLTTLRNINMSFSEIDTFSKFELPLLNNIPLCIAKMIVPYVNGNDYFIEQTRAATIKRFVYKMELININSSKKTVYIGSPKTKPMIEYKSENACEQENAFFRLWDKTTAFVFEFQCFMSNNPESHDGALFFSLRGLGIKNSWKIIEVSEEYFKFLENKVEE